MISQKTIEIVKSTAPILKERGQEITQRMYEIAFTKRPEYKRFFETTWMKHLDGGKQNAKLAASIYAYATHIEDLEQLETAVEHIAHRHVDSRVIAEQYPLIGECLLQAMQDVLQEVATPEIIAAWTEAYQALAQVFIQREKEIYQAEDQQLIQELSKQS